MSDLFYRVVRMAGSVAFAASARPVVLGAHNVPRRGPCILAPTHQSPFDVPLLIRHTPRLVDFVSITEIFQRPFIGWFYGHMNAFPLDRGRPDAPAVRTILTRLSAGRAVAVFPEGRICAGMDSVVHTRRIRKGLGRIAELSRAPVVPCVIINSMAYARVASWLPLRRTRYGVIYGPPLVSTGDPAALESEFLRQIVQLHAALNEVMSSPTDGVPPPPRCSP